MLQAARCDGLSIDPFSCPWDGSAAPEEDVSGRKVAGQVVVLEQDAVLGRLVPALDLAFDHRVVWRTTNMIHETLVQPRCQVVGDVG